jgi:hypothetical protein
MSGLEGAPRPGVEIFQGAENEKNTVHDRASFPPFD